MAYQETREKVIKLLKENSIKAFEFVRIAKGLCTCKTCKYFIQHYNNEGKEVEFGHCIQENTSKVRQPGQSCCGFWDIESEVEE